MRGGLPGRRQTHCERSVDHLGAGGQVAQAALAQIAGEPLEDGGQLEQRGGAEQRQRPEQRRPRAQEGGQERKGEDGIAPQRSGQAGGTPRRQHDAAQPGEALAKGVRVVQELGLDKTYGYKVRPISAVAA